ncbi:DNA structure-specific ATPase involved in suppression of recombination, MutS family [Halorhabdus sp. SVX81]|uniref:MutS-related protein n=1 Tax=Halorhabdus sp. SVX81 TaxID=2978283 RepID=UPI0023DA60EA|nr:helix-hairpin-helix domain-containing protein [Halorhabdus sp. SVX81]WEL16768.1 DNA structure-specific ATPase involved in suppression of recombination, MutS family [Halorhabdus sp. SVX81]
MDLTAIPGVGEKTAASLAELDDPAAAIENGDVAAVARAPGISQGRAARIVRAAIRERHGDAGEFLATARARELYQSVLDLLEARTVTDYAAARLETLYPSASDSRIAEVRALSERAMERDPDEAVLGVLDDVEPLERPGDVRVRDRCLATTDGETYAQAREAIPELSVEVVEDSRDLAELARGYATVVALDDSFAGVDVEGDVRVEPDALDDPASVVPERPLAFFAHNRDRILAAIAVHRTVALDASCDLDTLEAALDRLDAEGMPTGDDELRRLQTAVDDLDAAVSEAESVANDRLREAIEAQDVTIEGADLLSLVERGAGVDEVLSRELADEYDDAVEAAREHVIDTLDLRDVADIAKRAFPDEPTFPVEREESVVSRLREELTTARDRRAERLKRELADDLASMREPAEALVDAALELDVELAIARLAADFDASMPDIGGDGITIEGGRSPLLDVDFEDVEPVDYAVDGVRLLSGVNSGGKTSTLDLLALIVILAHMGLPVPAERARVGRIDALHYHAKTQGTLDAGAFESTLRSFGELVTDAASEGETLVLVDELESITEPGASAKIMAGILEALAERDQTAVFVSHLAREIRETADQDIGVDGIQALGLVDGELQVDRTPRKDTLARSTPELIVEKLAEDGGDGTGVAEFYGDLLAKFE